MIALGNPLAGDDAFGPRVLECLLQEKVDPSRVDLLDAHTDLLGAIGRFSDYGLVVLIDAVLDPAGNAGKPGEVVTVGEEDVGSWPNHSPGIHRMSPLLGLRLFRTLHPDAPTRIILVLLCVGSGEILSAGGFANDATVARGAEAVRRILMGMPRDQSEE